MSATVEREFEELDAENRWQQLYLVSHGLAQQPQSSAEDPGSRPPAPSRLPRLLLGRKWRRAGRVRGARAPTECLVPLEKKPLDWGVFFVSASAKSFLEGGSTAAPGGGRGRAPRPGRGVGNPGGRGYR